MERWNWSSATYRLDEITSRFPLPCVVQVMEGFLSETEAESVSAGDIIKIDSEKTLHKVAANFASTKPSSADSLHNDYVYLTREEILVPLSYQGKLNVLQDVQEYTSVKDLCEAWPRYAKLTETFRYRKNDGGTLKVSAGTIIELVREENGMLCFGYDRSGRRKNISVPLQTNGHFLSHPDENEYTLEEALDRYKLPFLVSFTTDDIKRVYTSDLMEGLSNMKTITETLRLNRRVTQKVLVGHYKPLEEVEETEDSRQRTLVVLPLNSSLVREIEVSVAEDVLEEDYVTVFQVFRNTDKDMEIVDGTLYVDLVSDTGMRRLEVLEEKQDDSQGESATPPRRTVRNSAFFDIGRRPPPPIPTVPQTVLMENYEEVTPKTSGQQTKRTEIQKPPPPPVQPKPHSRDKTKDGKKKNHERKKGKKAPDIIPPTRPPPRMPTVTPAVSPTGLTEDYEDVTPPLTSHMTGSRMEYQNTPTPSLRTNPVTTGFSLSEINFNTALTPDKPKKEYSNNGVYQGPKKKHIFNFFGKPKETHTYYNTYKPSKHVRTGNRPEMPLPDVPRAVGGENMLPHYEGISAGGENMLTQYEGIDVDGENMLHRYEGISVGGENTLIQYEGISESGLALYDQIDDPNATPTNTTIENNLNNASSQHLTPTAGRPLASVSPRSRTVTTPDEANAVKPFYKLTLVELEERLTVCGLPDLAEICRKENMDGSFFEDLSDDFLGNSPFNLDGFKLKKFRRVKDGWVPK